MLWRSADKGETTWLSSPEVSGYASADRAFEMVAAYDVVVANLTGGMEPERVNAALVTTNLFRALGVSALVGRNFEPADSASAIQDQVVIGYALWQRRFGGRSDIIGHSIQVDGRARIVIGVMPEAFRLPQDFAESRPSELFTAYDLGPTAAQFGNHSLIAIGRLKPGVERAAATSAMRAVVARGGAVAEGLHWPLSAADA
jgi:hypothetical protein